MPITPVVLIKDSGKAADILEFALSSPSRDEYVYEKSISFLDESVKDPCSPGAFDVIGIYFKVIFSCFGRIDFVFTKKNVL